MHSDDHNSEDNGSSNARSSHLDGETDSCADAGNSDILFHLSSAVVKTSNARGNMRKLCRHFAHKRPVELDDDRGRVEFPDGVCDLSVSENRESLSLSVSASSEPGRAQVEHVITRHLERFAYKETLDIQWSPVEPLGN